MSTDAPWDFSAVQRTVCTHNATSKTKQGRALGQQETGMG